MKEKTIVVVVQGHLSQSPRMVNHARSLHRAGASIRLVGYGDSAGLPPLPAGLEVMTVNGLGTERLPHFPRPLYLTLAAARAAVAGLRLWRCLDVAMRGADMVLIQVPPAVPSLALATWLAYRRSLPLVIDWHNQSFAVLGLRLGAGHLLTAALERLECRLARHAAGHLCVTPRLADDLRRRWRVAATVLPDRPTAEPPTAMTDDERRTRLTRLAQALGGRLPAGDGLPLVVVSPTSWSQDEDMGILLDALEGWPAEKPLLALATGRGPARAAFERRVRGRPRGAPQVLTGWLDWDDYPSLLCAADIGVSLHRSASGLDFPMKISDMISANLPVLALDYGPALREALPPPPAARPFANAAGLRAGLLALADPAARASAREAVRAAKAGSGAWSTDWDTAWRAAVPPLLATMSPGGRG